MRTHHSLLYRPLLERKGHINQVYVVYVRMCVCLYVCMYVCMCARLGVKYMSICIWLYLNTIFEYFVFVF